MKSSRHLLLFSCVLLGPGVSLESPAGADTLKIIDSRRMDFENSGCGSRGSCALRSFSLIVENYAVDLTGYPGLNYGTRLYAGYSTDSLSRMYEFGIVQFLRGCQYTSSLHDGKVVERLSVYRDYYGKKALFHHPRWAIDGIVKDPMDWGFESQPASRHFYYKWTPRAGDFKSPQARYVGQAGPGNSTLFVTDHPGVVSYSATSGIADNISLEFRTCVYRTADVPQDVPAEDVEFASPLKCFTWSSSHVYNFRTGRFDHPAALSPICLAPASLTGE